MKPFGNPVIDMLGRRLRLGVVGGGRASFIGGVHRAAAALDGRFEIAGGGTVVGCRRASSIDRS